ncbi:MAG TPA: diaminopimelate epimerase [Bacteroidales bacterium]|nr:diaminopimelate epimerase [Bacteroidales bacterium]
MKLPFCKYHGAGNDFILINNLSGDYHVTEKQINALCHRRFGIGADGLMLLERDEPPYGYFMNFFNSDGTEGTMCGNGGRCLVAFADSLGLKNHFFRSIDGPHTGLVMEKSGQYAKVKLQLNDVERISLYDKNCYVADTGSLHLVKFTDNVKDVDMAVEGPFWRWHKDFGEEGINVNFVEILDNGCLYVRTFERGVEDETWACGTGSAAAAISARMHTKSLLDHWFIQTKGGNLEVEFRQNGDSFADVFLTGGAVRTFEGHAEI